jgi:hypothetical protein
MEHPAEAVPLELAVRLFAWIITGVMIALLMYSKSSNRGGINKTTKNVGLVLSIANLAVWGAITYWFFVHYAELHAK